MTPRGGADLRFGPGTSCGFTPAEVAAFDDLRPAAVVRELVQNALDAARNAGVGTAVVRFRLTRVSKDSIPGIESYGIAFDKAIKTQEAMTGGPLTGQAGLAVETIRKALDQDEMDVLSVLDNGVGLDERSMNALLSDGVSVKGNNAAANGTYGNGHFTAIPASDLRYLLYGGVAKGGDRIGAGHAVLASHYEEGKAHQRSGDGFYVRGFQASLKTLYDYATGRQIPDLIARELDRIETDASHGTAVVIPSFNHFLEKRDGNDLWQMVSHAASANFFAAVEERALVVSVEDDRPGADKRRRNLDASSLAKVLDTHRDKRRATAFLSGRRAYEAHDVYRNGMRRVIETSAGDIEIRFREKLDGVTRVDLCRNGMWITDKVPMISRNLANQVPFHAVLSLDARRGGDLHDYIRNAEGPLHDSIAIKHLRSRGQRDACRSALRETRGWILRNTRTVESDAYLADDFLALDFGDADGSGRGRFGGAFHGVPTPIRNSARGYRIFNESGDLPGGGGNSNGGGAPPSGRDRARPWLPASFRVVSCPAGKNRRRILIECEKCCPDAQLRLVVDEALDATCERPGQDPYTPATLGNVTIHAKPAGNEDLVRWNDRVVGVRLGDLADGATVEVETDYRLHGDFSGLSDPSLRIEVFSAKRSEGAVRGAGGRGKQGSEP